MKELIKLNKARQALSEAKTLEDVRHIKDIAVAARAYAQAKKMGVEMENEAAEIIVRATREIGRILDEKQRAGEVAAKGKPPVNVPLGNILPKTLPEIGISRKESHVSKKISSLPEKEFEETMNKVKESGRRMSVSNFLKENVKEKNKNIQPMPSDKYRIIYADPPWNYGDKLLDGYGAAEHHYPSMTIKQLCELPVKEMSAENSVLFLWVTSPLLEESFAVIKAWGFSYKTSFVWDKQKHNMGHYNSVRHEFLLICTRGSCTPDNKKLFDSVQSIERTNKHSEKPEQFRNIIDIIYTKGKRIELFSRTTVKNWARWGNE